MIASPPRPYASTAALGYLIALAVGLASVYVSGALTSGFSGADESAHYLNGYFVGLYLRDHLGANPLGFATDFYLHYPKISIGHWPPAYYGFLGILFLAISPSPEHAFLVNLLVSALPAAGVAVALLHATSASTALLGTAVYAVAPVVLESYSFFMLDQALAGCVVAATFAWVAYSDRPGWTRAFGFAGLSALAVMVKGNGWLVVLIPSYHLLLTQRWRLLIRVDLLTAAATAALVVVPWYLITSKIAADGFNYQAGGAYALQALEFNAAVLLQNLTFVWLPLAAVGGVVAYRSRGSAPERWRVVAACLSLMLATLTLQSLVPADLVDRYVAPALPAVVVLAFIGVQAIGDFLGDTQRRAAAVAACVAAGCVLAAPGVLHLARRMPKTDLHMASVLARVDDSRRSAWVIDGTSGAEGAFIAGMAVRDPALSRYSVRASKLLSDSNFMGTAYQLKYPGPREVLAELKRLGIEGVVIVRIDDRPEFPHSTQLADALTLPESSFRRVLTFAHGNRRGTTDVFESTVAVAPDIAAIRKLGLPGKARALGATEVPP